MASRFRKIFIVCEDNTTFGNFTEVRIYKYRDGAEFACKRAQEKAKKDSEYLYKANKPLPQFKVHGFYLVHEDMFRD